MRGSDKPFRASVLEQGARSDRALRSAIATLYLQGVSTRRFTKFIEELCGCEVSSGLFPSEESLQRLITAVLVEISEA